MENRYFKTVIYSLMSLVFLVPGALGALYALCLPWPDLCKVPNVQALVILAPVLLVLFNIGSTYRARALKTARGRTMVKPVELGNYGFQLPSIFPKYQPEKVDMLDEATRGWRVPFDNGMKVNVYKVELRDWIGECYERQPRLSGKQSAISRRSNPKMDLMQHKARIFLLIKAKAVKKNSNASNSTLFLKDRGNEAPWLAAYEITEEIEERYERSIMIF